MKGYKSTEFWLTAAAHLAAMFLAAGIFPEKHVAVKVAAFIVAALATMGYTASRAFVKGKAAAPISVELLEPEEDSADMTPPPRN